MRRMQIIDGMLSGNNDWKLIGKTGLNPEVREWGERARIVCGHILSDVNYLHCRDKQFVWNCHYVPADVVLYSGEGNIVFLYLIEE